MARPGFVVMLVVTVAVVTAAAGTATDAAGPSGRWGAPQGIAARGATLAGVELDGAGDALAVWTDDGGSVHAAIRPADVRMWQRPVAIDPKAGRIDAIAVAANADGDAAVAYLAAARRSTRAAVVTGSMRTGVWRAPHRLGSARTGTRTDVIDVGLDAAGRASVVYGGVDRLTVASGSARTGAWARLVLLAVPSRLAQDPRLRVNAGGDAVVAWTRCPAGVRYVCSNGAAGRFEASMRAGPRGAWSRPSVVASRARLGGGNVDSSVVGLTDDGTALAAWPGDGLWSTTTTASSRWQAPTLVSRNIAWEDDAPGSVFLHADAGAFLVWSTHDGTLDGRRLDGTDWQPTRLGLVGAGGDVVAASGDWSVMAWNTESFNAPATAAVGTDEWRVYEDVGRGDGDLAGAAIDDSGRAILMWTTDTQLESVLFTPTD